jgi:hydrophobic/amphiphilic exporter-1 (mainly G- bacteria), HAE1 family
MAENVSSNQRLKIDPSQRESWYAKYFANPRLFILLILTIAAIGIFSFLNIPRVLNPSIDIAIVNISTVLPGASPEDIESLVTIPIEDAVAGVQDVKEVTSTSQNSVSVVSIEFESGADGEKARDDVQAAVDSAELPEDAQTPKVQKLDFQNQPVWSFTVTSKEDVASLTRFAKDLKQRIEDLPEVKEVNTTGLDEQEVEIILKPESIATYGLNTQALIGTIKGAVTAFPAGNVRTDSGSFAVTIDPSITTVQDIRNLKLNILNSVVPLGEIAAVVEKSKPEQNGSFFASPTEDVQPSINFDIYKSSSSEIEETAKKVEELATEVIADYENRFVIHSDQNSAEFIQEQFFELQRDFIITVSLVFLTLLIFLGLRQAVISSISIPLTFFITFVVMRYTGIEFSFIAFFSLLLSLGLLVDDTIVVISAMTAYYRQRLSPLDTGLLVWRDFIIPIFTSTLTTVWAFVPLLLSTGIIGEFIKPIPIVVSTTLLASFFIAMFVTLPFMVILLKPYIPPRVNILLRLLLLVGVVGLFIALVPKTNILLLQVLAFLVFLFVVFNIRKVFFSGVYTYLDRRMDVKETQNKAKSFVDQGLISFEPIINRYHNGIRRILYSHSGIRKVIAAVIIFFLLSVLLLPIGFVKNEFFPSSDEDYLYISLELPSGTNLKTTEEEAKRLLGELKNTKGLEFANANLGRSIDPFGGFGSATTNTALISMILSDDREKTSPEIAEEIRNKFNTYTTGRLNVTEVSGGPPAGSDLQIQLFGPDLNELDGYANRVQEYLTQQDGVSDVNKSIKPGTSKITFVPDQAKMAQNNISIEQLGGLLRTYASGLEAESIKFTGETEDKDITIRFSENSQYAETVSKLSVPTQTGGSLPLVSLGELKLEPNPTLITREGGNRTISVAAGVAEGFNIPEKNAELERFADTLNLPIGYSWKTGGVNEENQESVNSILQAMILSFLLIIVTMVIQFSSFRDALIVMLVIPLAVSGVFIIFALTKTPLSFPALIGVLALFGIVVKNSILLVDKINQNKKAGMPLREAIADASSTRIEPIFLTSFATIMGLLPITFSNPLWRGLGGAIIAGLTFSGTIMLFFIPVVYYLFFRGSEDEKVVRKKTF